MVGSGLVQKAGGKMGCWYITAPHPTTGNKDPIPEAGGVQTATGTRPQPHC